MRLFAFCLILFGTLYSFPSTSSAQSGGSELSYPMDEFLAHDRLMIGFEKGISIEEKGNILAQFPQLNSYTTGSDLQSPNCYVATMRDGKLLSPLELNTLLFRLKKEDKISYANPFIHSKKNNAIFGLTNKLILKLKDNSGLDQLEEACKKLQSSYSQNPFDPLKYHITLNKNFSSIAISNIDWFDQFEKLDYVEPVYLFNPIVTTNDFYFKYQWALDNLGGPFHSNGTIGADMSVVDAWTITTGNPNVLIGVLDSGTDTLHPDLLQNFKTGFDATGQGQNGYPNTNFASDGHGTACAGIIAAEANNTIGVAGVCYDCSFTPVHTFYYLNDPLLGLVPWSTGDMMADAINWAWQNGVDIMSCSWGIPDLFVPVLPGGSQQVEDAINDAATQGRGGKGCIIFFSSGNDGGAPIWPGRLANAISVNATSQCDERKHPSSCDGESWEGNWSDSLDIAAPGVRIATTDMLGANGFGSGSYITDFNGTSAACPNAAGVMGLILSMAPNINLATARALIESSCDKIGGYTYNINKTNGTWSDELGYGRVNAHAALMAISREDDIYSPVSRLRAWPNPSRGNVQFSFTLSKASSASYRVIDLQGKTMVEENFGSLAPGDHQNHIQFSDELPNGIYLLQLITDQHFEYLKLEILK